MHEKKISIKLKRRIRNQDAENTGLEKMTPGSYQRLDLFIKVLRVLCPNVTAATKRVNRSVGSSMITALIR